MSLPRTRQTVAAITLVLVTVLACIVPTLNLSLHHEIPESTSPSSKSIIEVIEERDGHESEDFNTATCSRSTFVIFGHINLHLTEDWRIPCALELYVEIGDDVSINPVMVTDAGGQQVDIDIATAAVSLHCARMADHHGTDESQRKGTRNIDDNLINEGPGPWPLAVRPTATIPNFQSFRYLSCSPKEEKICPLCVLPGSFLSRSAQQPGSDTAPWPSTSTQDADSVTKELYRQLMMANADYIWDVQSRPCDDAMQKLYMDNRYRWELMSDIPTIRTWQMLTYCVIFIVVQFLISLLQCTENIEPEAPYKLSGQYVLAVQTTCSGSNENDTRPSEHSSAWHSIYETGGLWSRDSAGRLTRQSVENCDDSCTDILKYSII